MYVWMLVFQILDVCVNWLLMTSQEIMDVSIAAIGHQWYQQCDPNAHGMFSRIMIFARPVCATSLDVLP